MSFGLNIFKSFGVNKFHTLPTRTRILLNSAGLASEHEQAVEGQPARWLRVRTLKPDHVTVLPHSSRLNLAENYSISPDLVTIL